MENKNFYVTIKGKQIEVTEEVYRAYVRPIRNEQRQKRRDWKCKVIGTKGNLIRCPNKCEECSYAKAGKPPKGNNLSLDELKECGIEIVDKGIDLEQKVTEEETRAEVVKELHQAVARLTPRQQQVVKMIYFEGCTQEYVRKELGIAKSSMSEVMGRILASLKRILQENRKNF